MRMHSGALILPLKEGDEVTSPTFNDIGRGLGRIVRFVGQTEHVYTLLGHTLTVAAIMPEEYAIGGLMHDTPEVIVSDVPSPAKSQAAKELELVLLERFYRHYGLPWPISEEMQLEIDKADYYALVAEGEILEHSEPESLRYMQGVFGDPPQLAYDLTEYHLRNTPQYFHPEVSGPIFAEAFEHYKRLFDAKFSTASVA